MQLLQAFRLRRLCVAHSSVLAPGSRLDGWLQPPSLDAFAMSEQPVGAIEIRVGHALGKEPSLHNAQCAHATWTWLEQCRYNHGAPGTSHRIRGGQPPM